MKRRDVLAIFNRGRISRLAVARTDVARVALSAEEQTNWMPRTLGPMMLRPGMGYIGPVAGSGALVPFIYATADSAILELTPGQMRIWVGGSALLTRPAVTTAIVNPTFPADLTGWTVADDAGASSSWVGGQMQLLGTGYQSARRRQQVTVVPGDQGKVHALRITIARGPVVLRIGTASGADDVFRQAVLRTGVHSIAFTPGASFWVEFSCSLSWPVLVSGCSVEPAGVVSVPTPWATAADCRRVRWAQSGDVVFCACKGFQQQRVERRPNGSWSVVDYEANDGPFLTENVENILLTPSAISGAITLTSSRSVFQAGHVGALFRLVSQGQTVSANLASNSTFTNAIRVTGVTAGRIFQVVRSGTWAGTLSLQRSLGSPGSWATVATYTANGSTSYDDGLDNSIAYYRIGFDAGAFTSGSATVTLNYSVGSITGAVRITAVASDVSASAVVVTALGGTAPTEIWAEGAWSDVQGWPSAVALWEGRLWWQRAGQNFGSVSDAFTVFDPGTEGDSGPINRRIGDGPVNEANWSLALQRLVVGTDGGEFSVRSSSLDEPVTPTNYNVKSPSTKGSVAVAPASADGRGYFVGRSGRQIFELQYDGAAAEFTALDATLLVPEIGDPGFVRIATQQNPDVRLYAVKADGGVAVMVRDRAEDVLCWWDIETDGAVEDVCVLPGDIEDAVFFLVRRSAGGVSVRYLERMARMDEARGGKLTKLADSFLTGTGMVTGLVHLEGRAVSVWADGHDAGNFTVVAGEVPVTAVAWCAGLPYEARYRSAKLAGQTALGLSLTQRSRIDAIGLILADTHAQGIRFGPDFDTLDDLPAIEDGALVDGRMIWAAYDKDMVEFPGDWDTDNRLCLVASSPRPCTVLAAVLSIDREDKA